MSYSIQSLLLFLVVTYDRFYPNKFQAHDLRYFWDLENINTSEFLSESEF